MGNFSINHYTAVRLRADGIELRYVIDMAEIPTFQEIQEAGIVADPGHPSVSPYLVRQVETLREGLTLEVNGRRLSLRVESTEVIFPPGAGGLPTMKVGVVYRAGLEPASPAGLQTLRYRDGNYPGRAGWKEIVATADPGVGLAESSVPSSDRSRELADYPSDLLNSPPQDLEAHVVFALPAAARSGVAAAQRGSPPSRPPREPAMQPVSPLATAAPASEPAPPASAPFPGESVAGALTLRASPQGTAAAPLPGESVAGAPTLRANPQGTPRNSFTDLIATPELGLGIIPIALLVAAGLGAFHALEPGHGKTVVAAYLVGARGTGWHAMVLGLVVTASHTAGVFLLGGVTLYASRHVVPEQLYPWLGALSGMIIAALGLTLFLRRFAGPAHEHHGHAHLHEHSHPQDHPHGHARPQDHPHGHAHPHEHGQSHDHGGATAPAHAHEHGPGGPAGRHRHHDAGSPVSLGQLFALGVSGGIVPCPAALVVLLSAISLQRVGFGLLLIVAFSVGLAAVLIGVGLLMVYARRFMSRFHGEGRVITRWLPLTSSAVVTVLGVAIAAQSLASAFRIGLG